VGFQNRAQVADLRVLLRLRSCDWQHRGLVMVRMLYLMLVRLAGWMALLAVACASAPAPLTATEPTGPERSPPAASAEATSPGRQLVRRNAPMAAMESSCVVIV